jgi:predicted DNA-binding protein
MPKKTEKESTGGSFQTAIRLENEVIKRVDALVEKLSRPGLRLGRSDVLRMAIAEGLPVLERS